METSVVKFSVDTNTGGVATIRSITAKGSIFFYGNLPMYFNSAKQSVC